MTHGRGGGGKNIKKCDIRAGCGMRCMVKKWYFLKWYTFLLPPYWLFLLWKHTCLFKHASYFEMAYWIHIFLWTKCKLKVETRFNGNFLLFKAQIRFWGVLLGNLFVCILFEVKLLLNKSFLLVPRWLFNFFTIHKKLHLKNLAIRISFHLVYFGDMFGSTEAIAACSP